MKCIPSIPSFAAAIALACIAPFALAQTNPASQDHPQSGAVTHTPPFQTPPPQDKTQPANPDQTSSQAQPGQEMGQHDMRGTVEAVSQNGMVKVRTAEGTLKVHFPQASQHLKKGDTITLHLAYTVDETSGGPSSP
ncbi:MAG TPA: hypothetical protein VJ862_09600 [Rhodanobacteraceae bacterium]|nr:hypothetical protein [Rhodanobacteraceae bacterium]